MSLIEIEHPIAQELAVVLRAAELGLGSSDHMPENTALHFTSPLDSANGAAIEQLADKETANMTAIHVPVFSGFDSGLTLMSEDGLSLTEARIKIADVNGDYFPISVGDEDRPSLYIQFDVSVDGIIFSAEPYGEKVAVYGVFESELYANWAKLARSQASIEKLYEASRRYLDAAL